MGQFNFSTLEQMRGIFEAARALNSPVILGVSEGEAKFLGLEEIIALKSIMERKYKIPAFLNLDHGKDTDILTRAIKLGYEMTHFDGSFLTLEENIKYAKKIAEISHKAGALTEGELGSIKGESVLHKNSLLEETDLTRPKDVKSFVRETKVDLLAISIGSSHGIYTNEPNLDIKRLTEIKKETNAFLVLHGGSGISENEIRQAIKAGICKININTEIRVEWKNSLRRALAENEDEFKPYKILPAVIASIKNKVEEKIKLFGSANKA